MASAGLRCPAVDVYKRQVPDLAGGAASALFAFHELRGADVYKRQALAIAGALKKADPTAEIHFAGRQEGMEYRLVTQAGYPFHHIEITGFQRKLSLHTVSYTHLDVYERQPSPSATRWATPLQTPTPPPVPPRTAPIWCCRWM